MHAIPWLGIFHDDHHNFISTNKTSWSWNNFLLFTDTWLSTLDLWITEVIPTLVFAWLSTNWWLLIFYYLWAAFLQETIEHNDNIDLYPLTSGKWHLIHHKIPSKNFGLFLPIWDKIFQSELR